MTLTGDASKDLVEVWVREKGDVAIAVFQARRFVCSYGVDTWTCAEIATACSELASNIVKYAGQGKIVLYFEEYVGRNSIVLWACDRGPGIRDLENAMRESYSSSGTLGLGLPSVRRIMDLFSIESCEQGGCSIIARKYI